MRNIDTNLLRCFVTVVETQSMTVAARQLNLTQAAVSQQIKRLEDLFQLPLLDRERRQLVPTRDGERLLGRAQRMLAINDDIWSSMTAPEFEGEVTIGVPHDIVSVVMPPVLKRFDRAWPRVHVSLRCSTTPRLLQALEDGEIDLTLTTEADCGRGGEILLTDRLVWAGAAGGTAHRLDPLPISLGDERCAFRPSVTEALASMDRTWRSVCDEGSMQALWATIFADLAVSAVLESTLPPGAEILNAAHGLPALPNFHINLYTRTGAVSDLAAELANHIRREFTAVAKAA